MKSGHTKYFYVKKLSNGKSYLALIKFCEIVWQLTISGFDFVWISTSRSQFIMCHSITNIIAITLNSDSDLVN